MTAGALVSGVPGAALGGALLGSWIDTLAGTGRVFTIFLLVAGFGAGIVQLFRGLARLDHADPPEPPP